MKKSIKPMKSPFKLTDKEKAAQKSTQINKTKEGVAYKSVSTNKSSSAGEMLSNSAAAQTKPTTPSTKNVDMLKAKGKNLGPNYKPSAAETKRANQRLADAKAKDALESTTSPQNIAAPAIDAPISAKEDSSTAIPTKEIAGFKAIDARGDIRTGKFLARAAGQAERKAGKQEAKAAKLDTKGKTSKAESLRTKANLNKGVSENAKQLSAKLKEGNQQGSTGYTRRATSEAVTLAEQDANAKGISTGTKSIEKEVSQPATTITTTSRGDSQLPALTMAEAVKKKSPLDMFKASAFKMIGFGNKNKK